MASWQKTFTLVFGTFVVLGLVLALQHTASALTIMDGVNAARGDGQPTELFGDGGFVTTITNVLLFLVGALSVIMLMFGGLRYVVSAGNPTAVTAAKNTILYAIVGLVVALLAFTIINFVLAALTSGSTGFTNV